MPLLQLGSSAQADSLESQEQEKDTKLKSIEEELQTLKSRGNAFFVDKKMTGAIEQFSQGIDIYLVKCHSEMNSAGIKTKAT